MSTATNRRALRAGIPWLTAGFVVLLASVGLRVLEAVPGLGWAASPTAAGAARAAGALGSGLVLVGAALLARARVFGHHVGALLAFFGLWLGELVLRLWTLASGADPAGVVAARVVLAGAAMAALATGMLGVWERAEPPRRVRDSWLVTRRLFGVQLAACAAVPLAVWLAGESLEGQVGRPGLVAIAAWLAFAAPYAHLILSLQRSTRWVLRPESVAEILTG